SEHTQVDLSYAGPSLVRADGDTTLIRLSANLQRDPVSVSGTVADPLRLREALSVLHGIIASDFRYVPKDRIAYLAYMRMKRETASLGMWAAQQANFAWIQRNDPLAFLPLDPAVTSHPAHLPFEA